MVTTRASSAGFATPSADRIMRLEARVAEGDVELAIAECHALTGVGCLQGEPAAGAVVLRIWMPWDDSPGADGLRDHLAGAGIAAHVEQAEEGREWQSALRDFHQPVVAGRIRVRPPWVAPAPGMHDVVIDPGMAFGTGQHATTRTALELLQRIPHRGEVLDAGCGSGVLAIAARRIGMGPVTAIDFDPDSVSATPRAATPPRPGASRCSARAPRASLSKRRTRPTPMKTAAARRSCSPTSPSRCWASWRRPSSNR